MPDMLVRNIKPETMAFLKRKAAARGHTVQDEVREMLDELEQHESERRQDFWAKADLIREGLRGTMQEDSAVLRHADRRGEA